MNVSRVFMSKPERNSYRFFRIGKGDDHRSAAVTLLREAEKNKLSSIERAWIGGATQYAFFCARSKR